MGGTLTAEDTPGGGLTLALSLPAAGPPAPGRPTLADAALHAAEPAP